jgi:hypothetical protein
LPKFLAIHTLPEPMEAESVTPLAKKVKSYCTLDAYWVGSWVQLNDDGKISRFICEWDAKDVASIQKLFEKIPELPTDGIYPMSKLDAEAFR